MLFWYIRFYSILSCSGMFFFSTLFFLLILVYIHVLVYSIVIYPVDSILYYRYVGLFLSVQICSVLFIYNSTHPYTISRRVCWPSLFISILYIYIQLCFSCLLFVLVLFCSTLCLEWFISILSCSILLILFLQLCIGLFTSVHFYLVTLFSLFFDFMFSYAVLFFLCITLQLCLSSLFYLFSFYYAQVFYSILCIGQIFTISFYLHYCWITFVKR